MPNSQSTKSNKRWDGNHGHEYNALVNGGIVQLCSQEILIELNEIMSA